MAFSEPAAGAIHENAELERLRHDLAQRNAELAILNSVQQGLASRLDIQAIYDLVGDKIREIFDAQVVSILVYDLEKGVSNHRYVIEKGERFYPGPLPLRRGGLRDYLIRTGRPFLVDHDFEAQMAPYGGVRIVPGTEMPKSAVWVPLFAAGTMRGNISLQNIDHEYAFSETDVRLLETLANSMSVALENARLFDETERLLVETEQRAAELAIINTVSSALASELDLDALIRLTGEQMRQIFNADIVYVALVDAQANQIDFPYSYGEAFSSIPLGMGITSRILQTGQPIVINEEMEKQGPAFGAVHIGGDRARAYLGVPILVGKQAIGVISVQSARQEDRFRDEDLRLLTTLAANVATAIHNARLFEETRRRERESAATGEILRILSSSPTNLQPALDTVAEMAARLCAAEDAIILGARDGFHYPLAFYGAPPTLNTNARMPVDRQTVAGRAMLDGTTIHICDILAEPLEEFRRSQEINAPLGFHCLLAAPLMHEGQAIGAILLRRAEVNPFTHNQIELLQMFADQAVIGLVNSNLFSEMSRAREEMEREIDLARETQQSILPEAVPVHPGYDFGALIVPARTVGGDFYEFIDFKKGRLGIVIGDVSDKGLPAALFMALTYSLVRAEAGRTSAPGRVLSGVNRHLLQMNTARMFVTLTYAVLDYESGTLTYARAGHPYPLILDAAGAVIPLQHQEGQPLGLLERPVFDEQTVTIPPGGLVCLFTDGVNEAESDDAGQFGLEGLQALLKKRQLSSAQGICDDLWEAVQDHVCKPCQDDFTVVMIKRE